MSKERGPAPSPPTGHVEAHARQQAEAGGYFRVRLWLPAHPEPPAFDVVVAGRNASEAEGVACAQGGIRSVDKSVNTVEITVATEPQFVMAQAKRLGVDLRMQRKTDIPEEEAQYGLLLWTPGGMQLSRPYWVTEQGEVVEKKPDQMTR